MIWMVLAALKGMVWKDNSGPNLVGKILAACVAGVIALKAYGYQQQHVGAQRLATKIEQKAKANAKQADTVRTRSLSGAGGVRDPHQRLD